MTMRHPPKFTQGFVDRNGKARFYFRRRGYKRVVLPGLPWSPSFMAAYEAAMAGEPPPQVILRPTAKSGSMAALAASYFASATYRSLKPRTQTRYNNTIERLCALKDKNGVVLGTLGAATLRPDHARSIMGTKEKPDAANILRRVLRGLMQHAIEIGLRDDDPTRDVKAVRRKNQDGYHSWSDDEIAQFEARHPIGGKARLALALLLYTGQRRSDVVTMGRQHVDKHGAIRVVQFKTGAALTIPIHPDLRAIIDATPSDHLTFLTLATGRSFSSEGFGQWFRQRCDERACRIAPRTVCARRRRDFWRRRDAVRMRSRASPAMPRCGRSNATRKPSTRRGWPSVRWTK